MIKIGEINEFQVKRKSDLGYMLVNGQEEVLLHFKQAVKEYADGEKVDAFVYFDSKGRMCATTYEPFVTVSKCGYVKVVDTNDVGVFVNINTPKDVLISTDNLPYNKELWPKVGDEILVKLKIKKDSFLAKPLNQVEIGELHDEKSVLNEKNIVEASVYRIMESGILCVTKTFESIFIGKKNMRKKYRLGEVVEITITQVKEDGYIGTLTLQKEFMMDSDAKIIIEYLKRNNNKTSLTAKSSAEEIENAVGLSRKAFKRALGNMYKKQMVDCEEFETILLKYE